MYVTTHPFMAMPFAR